MNGLALCAGVGGLELGVGLALGDEYRTVCYVEREAYAAAILAARMGEALLAPAPIWDDLATFDGRPWRGCVDLVTAGYPCQPFSTAGKRAGADDPRHLWPHVLRIWRECGSVWLFCENVPGHLNLGFLEVCRDLQGVGARVAAGLFSAAEVGAPHRRQRLFFLAHRDGGMPGGCGSDGGTSRHSHEPDADGCGASLGQSDDLGLGRAPALRQASKSGSCAPQAGPEHLGAGSRPTWPPSPEGDWSDVPAELWPATAQSSVHRVADGAASRVDRLRACGNGVVPLCAAHALRTLAAELGGLS